MAEKRKALGKGLAALLKDPREEVESAEQSGAEDLVGSIAEIPVDQIKENPFQPRTYFDEEALQELADSIKELGVIQPITVRRVKKNKYELISGERRLRASKLAGLDQIPAYIRLANDQGMLEMALVENIQRQELDAVEVALSYQRLIDEIGITQEEMSKRVGKKRSTVTNYLRLLKLPPIIQAGIRDRMLSMGHARALVNLPDENIQLDLYKNILAKGYSVRQVEDQVKKLQSGTDEALPPPSSSSAKLQKPLGQELSALLSTKVQVKERSNGQGEIVIRYEGPEELERIVSLINP